MSEFAPPWRKVRMSKAQVKKYIKDLKEKRRIAQEKLKKARESWEFLQEEIELQEIEKILDQEL